MIKPGKYIPLIGKAIWQSTPEEFRAQIDSMYIDPEEGKPPKKEASLSFNKKGNPVIRIKRDPKWISPEEITEWASEHKRTEREIYIWLGKRDIKILRIN